jgi:hypothetical protein
MPNPSSGAISLSDINSAFGYDPTVQIDMGLYPVTLGAGASAGGQAQMSGFYYTQVGAVPATTANVGSGSSGTAQQGISIALSNDGLTLAVGGNTDNTNIGAVWVFTRSTATSTTWTQQGSKLVGTGGVGTPKQGTSVALSADGNYLVVGGSNDNGGIGAVWVWTRSGSTWTQQTKIVPTGYTGTPAFGSAVAILPDCDLLAVGAPNNNGGQGGVWTFSRSITTWTQLAAIGPGNGDINGNAGTSVSLIKWKTQSLNGSQWLVAFGAPNFGTLLGGKYAGAAYIYRSNPSNPTSWTFDSAATNGGVFGRLQGTGATGTKGAAQGTSVAFSANGNTLAVGAPFDATSAGIGNGSVWVFSRTYDGLIFPFTGVWSQQALITPNNIPSGMNFNANWGAAVALSADGNVLATSGYAAGGGNYSDAIGVMNVFTRSGSTWNFNPSITSGLLINGGTGTGTSSWKGYSLSLTGNGNSLAFGAPADNSNNGGFWVAQ